MDDDTADGEKPDYHPHNLLEAYSIFSNLAINRYLMQEVDADIEVEDSGYADGAKESHKRGLLELLDLRDLLVHGEYDRDTAEQ